jgi:hypothetical protein
MFYKLKKTYAMVRVLTYHAAIAAALLPLALGCKREALNEQNTSLANTPAHKVQKWLNGLPLPKATAGRTAGNALPKNTLQWGSATFSKNSATHFIPATLLQEGTGNPYARAGLVATEDVKGQITGGHYIVVVPDQQKMGTEAAKHYSLARLYRPQPQEPPTGFSGAVLYYNTAGQPTASRVYNNGQAQQGATAMFTAKPQAPGSEANKVPRNCDGPSQEGCIDWYYQTYVDGVLVYEEYQFTTCCNSSGGGGGVITNDEGPCGSECQGFGTMANQISGQDQSIMTVVSSTPISGPDSTGKIRVGRMIKMDFYKLDFFWGYYARFSAYYQGVAYKNNVNEADWKWEGLSHAPPSDANGYHTEGEVPGCFSVKAIYNPMPIMYSGDKRFAYIGYNFNVKAYFKCPIMEEIHNHPGSATNVQINANREN